MVNFTHSHSHLFSSDGLFFIHLFINKQSFSILPSAELAQTLTHKDKAHTKTRDLFHKFENHLRENPQALNESPQRVHPLAVTTAVGVGPPVPKLRCTLQVSPMDWSRNAFFSGTVPKIPPPPSNLEASLWSLHKTVFHKDFTGASSLINTSQQANWAGSPVW